MKKALFLAAFCLAALSVTAQEENKFTVRVGAGISKIVGSDADTKNAFAYKVGATYDLGVGGNFFVIPGIELDIKGAKSDNIDGTIHMGYLQVPIFAAYKFPISDGQKLTLKVGPYLSYGLFGSDIEWYDGDKTNVFDSDEGFDRFDVGVTAGVAYEFSKFEIGVEYSRGLKKLESDFKAYNQAFGLVLGYKF